MTKAICLLSGGQDSTTCLYWAKKQFDKVYAMSFFYGQKHQVELRQAHKIATDAGVAVHLINDVSTLLSGSSLTDHNVDHNTSHPQNAALPASFTAGRNALFLTIAASTAYNMGVRDIVTGVCQTDYSGYPDCRRDFIDAMEVSLSLAMDPAYKLFDKAIFQIHTPLMFLTKAETWKMAADLGTAYGTACGGAEDKYTSVLDVIINDTMTDYNGSMVMNDWGMGVDNNPATHLRAEGYYEAKRNGWI